MIFEELGATPWAARAREELEASGVAGSGPAPAAPLGALSPRELRIAMLVAEGATNREVGEQLFLSPKTIEMHLSGAFRKLNVRSRTELATTLARAVAPPQGGATGRPAPRP
jgi:DNA-binding NarL/FixJ family response regulator